MLERTRRTVFTAVAAALAVAVTGVQLSIPGSAAGAGSLLGSEIVTQDIEVGPVLGRWDVWNYGEQFVHGQQTNRTITIASGSDAEVVIDSASLQETGITALPGGVDCAWVSGERHFTQEQWTSPVPSDRTIDPGGADDILCTSGDPSALPFVGTRWTAVWLLNRADGAPNPATLGGPDQLTSHVVDLHHGIADTSEGYRLPMREGDGVRLVGPTGTWPSDPAEPPETWWDFEDDAHGVWVGASVSQDGTALTSSVPMRGLASDETLNGVVRARATAHEPGIPWSTTNAIWAADIVLTDGKLPTATRIALSNSVTVSIRPVRATAVVTTSSGDDPPGSVSFLVDGREVQRVELPPGAEARVTVTLPNMTRGVHDVVAVYNGGDDYASSTSLTKRVRVLL